MNPVQYLILNKGLGMSTGKAAAQAAHASVEGVRLSAKTPGGNPWDASIVNRWYRGGHYAKIVLEAEDGAALQVARSYIEARGFKTALIIDEGRTEIEPMSVTALGCEIVDKDWPHARETFSAFTLYSDSPTFTPLTEEEREVIRKDLREAARGLPSHYSDFIWIKGGDVRPNWLKRRRAKAELEARIKKALQEERPTILP